MKAYFISGIVADERLFENIQLPANYNFEYLPWIKPKKKESLKDYAKQMAEGIDASKPFILIGLSFGGMIAAEIARILQPKKTILISSARSNKYLPPYFKLASYLDLHKIIPAAYYKKPLPLIHWAFGVKTEEGKALINDIIINADHKLLKWSIAAILEWKTKKAADNIIHIHGDADKTLPVQWAGADIVIKGGEHFMIWSKGDEVSQVLQEVLV